MSKEYVLVTGDSYVVQSNQMAQGRYASDASIHALRLIAVSIAKVDRDLDMFGQVEVTSEELRSIFPAYARSGSISALIRQAVDRLLGLRAETREQDGSWRLANVIVECSYSARRGSLVVQFHPDMRKFLLKLTGSYTRYQLKAISALTSTYHFHLFQFLRSYTHMGSVTVHVSDLRERLHLGDAYARFKYLRERVLDPAVDAINDNSDIDVSYSLKKEGREVKSVTFRITPKEGQQTFFERAALSVLTGEGLSTGQAADSIRVHGTVRAMMMTAYARHKAGISVTPVANKSAYLVRMLKGGDIKMDDPAVKKHYVVVMDTFRSFCFEHMTTDEQQSWLAAFKDQLPARDLADFERFKCFETLQLKARWRDFLREHINPDNPRFRLHGI